MHWNARAWPLYRYARSRENIGDSEMGGASKLDFETPPHGVIYVQFSNNVTSTDIIAVPVPNP